MKKETSHKRGEVKVRYTAEDFIRVKKAFARSTCTTIAGYVRKISLGEPIEIITRNASFDTFIEEIVLLRKEMAVLRTQINLSPADQANLFRLHEHIQQTIDKIAALCTPQ
ncbi:MAG TPA: hypothetical protein VKQ52_12835 [Puia sp.]|nr:hypothetical protein [Puia sp.]